MTAPTLPPSQSCTQESVRSRKGKLLTHWGQEQHSGDCLGDRLNLLQDFTQNKTEVACHQICTSVLESGVSDFLYISSFSSSRYIVISFPPTPHMIIHSCSWQYCTHQLHWSIFSGEAIGRFVPRLELLHGDPRFGKFWSSAETTDFRLINSGKT